ncbi:MAG: DUF620 domain-containing protein [Pirellula sp.]|jgi:hypothetical protein
MSIKRITYVSFVATLVALSVGFSQSVEARLHPGLSCNAEKADEKSDNDLPSAEEILNLYVKALGGKEKLQAIKNMVSNGSLAIPAAGIKGEVVIRQATDGKFKMTAEIPGVVDSETGSDGKVIWEVSSVTGAELLEGVRADQARFQMALFPALDMKKFFESMECTGKENFAGEECYVVIYKNKKTPPMTTYYSVKTGLERGNRLNTVTAMGDLNIVTEVKAYAEVDGVKYAKEVEATLPNGMKQLISMDKVELNAKFGDNEFVPSSEVTDLIKK